MTKLSSFLVRKYGLFKTGSAAPPPSCQPLSSGANAEPSGLFSRLPFEIRYMIFAYALGGNLLLLTRNVLEMDEYPMFQTTRPVIYCRHQSGRPRSYQSSDSYQGLNLVLTCKQIYLEAMPMIYSTNAFGICGMDNLSYLFNCFRQMRKENLEMINSFCISCHVDDSRTGRSFGPSRHSKVFWMHFWTGIWETFATQMPALKEIEVRLLKSHYPPLKFSLEEDWVQPMLQVRGLKSFSFNFAQVLGSGDSTAEYNEKLDQFKNELKSSLCSPK